MNNRQKLSLTMGILSIISIIGIFYWAKYLVNNDFIIECFGPQAISDTGSSETNHNVDLVNSQYSCRNFCGPPNRCSISGEQCSTDVDCEGCQKPKNPKDGLKPYQKNIRGQNDAGKYSYIGDIPSVLTTDIGTQASLTGPDYLKRAPQWMEGVNVWRKQYDIAEKMFNDRYEPKGLEYEPIYPKRWSLSGQFVDNGPLASNAYLKQY